MRKKPPASIYPSFRLNQWVALRLQLLWAYEKVMETSTSVSRGTEYTFQSALLVRKGWALLGSSEEEALRADPGQWIILGQGWRWQRFSPDCVLFSIGFRFQLPNGEPIYDKGFPLRIESEDFPQLKREAFKVMRSIKKHIGLGFYLGERSIDMRDYLLSQNALRLFLIELAAVFSAHGIAPRHLSEHSDPVRGTLELIQRMPPGKVLKSAEVARRIGLSQTHLDRLMVVETGHTVHQQIELLRLQQAQAALQARTASLKSIAYDLGFCSPSHFHSWFRRHQGMTPMQFRERNAW